MDIATLLKRSPTVMSMSQLEGVDASLPWGDADAKGKAASASVRDCPGNNLPLYSYAPCRPTGLKYRRVARKDSIAIVPDDPEDESRSAISWDSLDDDSSDGESLAATVPVLPTSPDSPRGASFGLLDNVVSALWDDCEAQGLFRYKRSSISTKVLQGGSRYVIQLNEGRAKKKRATEFRVDRVVQQFDASKFNFQKALMKEVLFQFEAAADNLSSIPGRAMVDSATTGASPNLVMINVSPIDYGHVLLVPRVMDNLPQLVDASTAELALHFAKEVNNQRFRVGYNSLGAYASVNHLHYQGYYLDHVYPCEDASTAALPPAVFGRKHARASKGLVTVRRFGPDYPVNGFVLETRKEACIADGIPEMAALLGAACAAMQAANQPHNLLVSDCGRRVALWPNCFGEKVAAQSLPDDVVDTDVQPGAFEIAGHVLLKQADDYAGVSDELCRRLLAEASLPEERFLQLAAACFGGQKQA